MSRAVTADHVLFDECIDAFRQNPDFNQKPTVVGKPSYLLTSFEIMESWELPHCTISPSKRVNLPGAMSAFICHVENPDWVEHRNAHLYGIALSSVVSFSTGKLCKSTRNRNLFSGSTLTEYTCYQLALLHPILTAGPGNALPMLPSATISEYKTDLFSLVTKLHSLPYKTYVVLMQAIRLVHLSLLNKRDDFGLAYLLLVSAIESIAQHAVKRDAVKSKHPSEATWKQMASQDSTIEELLKEYRELRGQNQYLKERYIKFICQYAPPKDWEDIVRHPLQDMTDYMKEESPSVDLDYVVQKKWFEEYPTDLSEEQIREILADSYTHRSCFIHRGEQPPHLDPTSYNRFFQKIRQVKDDQHIEKLVLNYDLLFGIAQRSIRRWAESK
jgi:hypothetical protein